MKTDPIQDYILKSEENIRIAAAVSEAWPDARQSLATGFLDRLEERLKKQLKGWAFERWLSYFNDRDPVFYFFKPAWKAKYDEPQYYVNLQLCDYGKEMVFGLARNVNFKHISIRPHYAELLASISAVHPSASAKTWWEARVVMHSPATDWRKPDILWRMNTDREFLNVVAEQLLQVARVSEPIVDRLVRKK